MRRLCLVVAMMVPIPALATDVRRGTVDDVSSTELRLDDGATLQVDRGVQVLRNESEVTLDALEPGDTVRASFDAEGELVRVEATGSDEVSPKTPGWDASGE